MEIPSFYNFCLFRLPDVLGTRFTPAINSCGLSSDGLRRLLSRSDDSEWGVAALCCHRPPGTTRLSRSWRCSLAPTREVLARPSARLSQRACCLKKLFTCQGTPCRRPPFVAATLSTFTVSQQRWDCDIPTVTLALPLATFDQSVFLSPYPYYNFKSAFWPVFSKLFCRTKKERSALQTVHKKAAHKLLVPVAFGSAICYTDGVHTTTERK